MSGVVGVINAGSSSLKFSIYAEDALLLTGQVDGIVFTAGVGENAAPIRAAVCEASRWLGVELDAAANAAKAGTISRAGSRVAVHVIPTDENLMIARHTRRVLAGVGQ